MQQVAFELVAEYQGTTEQEIDGEIVEVPTFQGGVFATGGKDLHLRDELDAGDGVLVVDLVAIDGETGEERSNDDGVALVELLDQLPALKRCAVPDDRKLDKGPTVPELRAQLKALDLPYTGKKSELVARLAEAEAGDGSSGDGDGTGDDTNQGS